MTPPKGYRLVKRGMIRKGDFIFYCGQWNKALGVIGFTVDTFSPICRKTAKRGKR
jgi:hypothetical protein